MSQLDWLEVRDFRNLVHLEFSPQAEGLTVLTGDNGSGKTSILEAIAYLATERSFRRSPREALVRNGAPRAWLRSTESTAGRRATVEIEVAPPRRDQVRLNDKKVTQVGKLLEVLQVTIFTPDDLVLVKGAPVERRDYLDEVMTMARPRLAAVCQQLERVLRQRAVLLRQLSGRLDADSARTLDVWDEQLASSGTTVVEAREALVGALEPLAAAAFARLTKIDEPLCLDYRRSFEGELAAALTSARGEDLRRGVTTLGPHRDDLAITLGMLDGRTRLSQGRQRAVTLALRLAAHEYVSESIGSRPVLLLDDAFSELDDTTAAALFSELPSGQAILTTAGPLPANSDVAERFQLRDGRLTR